MTNIFATVAMLTTAMMSSSIDSVGTDSLPVARLAGTWVQAENSSLDCDETPKGILESQPTLQFHDGKSADSMKPAFVEKRFVNSPLHIGSVTADHGDVLLLLRGRIGFVEMGTTAGGGVTKWEQTHLVQSAKPENDRLIIGGTIFRRADNKPNH